MQSSVLIVAVALMAPAPKEAPKKEMPPSIVGEWTLDKIVIGGMNINLPGTTLELKADGTISMTRMGRDPQSGTYKLDDKQTPPHFDWSLPTAGVTMPGLFRLEGDTLTICVADGVGADRPKLFESPAGSKVMLWTMKRVVPAKK